MFAFMLATVLSSAPAGDVRKRELLSSVIISGTCARGCEGERRLFGTGEIVARRGDGRLVVLTARHVIADMADPRIYLRNGAPEGTRVTAAVRERPGIPAEVIAQSADSDLAVVDFRSEPDDAYGLAMFSTDASVQSGDVVGGPYGALWTVSPYRVVSPESGATLVSCETCGPGDSGGGVFDRRGALAGILVSQQVFVKENEPLAFAKRSTRFKIVPLEVVRSFIASLPLEAPAAPVAVNDPWTRFERPAIGSQGDSRDPWSRFDSHRAAGP